MTIEALHLGSAREIACTGSEEWWDKPWTTGFIKTPQAGACWLGYEGFKGDEQADRRHHGGVDKAVCVYPAEHYLHWRTTLRLPELGYGAFGENLTTSGCTEAHVCIGDVFSLGEALVQVSQPRQPCWKLARRWRVKDLTAQVERNGFTGYYFRVLRHGWVKVGDQATLLEHTFPQWTVARCNEIMHHQKQDSQSAAQLADCSALSASWKDSLWARAQHNAKADGERTRI